MLIPSTIDRRGPPQVWIIFAKFWGVSDLQARRWWLALCKTRHPRVRQLVHQFLYFDTSPTGAPHVVLPFVRSTCKPTVMVDSLEVAVEEGHLTRREATAIEEDLFRRIRQGEWR